MKITHLITSLEGGGTENFLWQVLAYSPAAVSHEVLYLKKDGVIGKRIRDLGISVQSANAGGLWRALRAWQPDILHTCLYRAHQVGRVLGKMAGVKRIVSSQRSIDAWQKPWHVYLDGFTLPFCDQVIVNSSAAEALVRRRIRGHATPKVTRILNGVDVARFTPQDRQSARQKLGLPSGHISIGGSLMRLHAEKGADFILPFAEKTLHENPALHLAVGGVGPLEAALRAETQKRPWGARLHWLGWVEDTPAFYAALDFFWSLSREESFPQSLLEATVMSLPWLAPAVGGVPDLVTAGAPGHLYLAANILKASEAAQQLFHSKESGLKGAPLAAFRRAFGVQEMVSRFYAALGQ